jgi:uncharacterized membrane protein YdjX (TVP38/TMEM64 family)
MPPPALDPSDPSVATAPFTLPPSRWQRFKTVINRLGPAGPLALLAATFPPLGGFVLIAYSSRLGYWLRAHPDTGFWIYLLGAAILTALAMLPTYACAFLGGWAFGLWRGFPISMGAFCGGALLAYLINARAAGDRVVAIVKEHPKWEAVRVALLGSGFWKSLWIITLLRLPPQSPFAATNFVLATTRAPIGAYVLATFIGMAPRTAVAVWAAAHARTLDFSDGKNIWSFTIGLIVTIAIVAVIGHLAKQAIARVTAQPE